MPVSFLPVGLVPVGLRSAIVTTWTPAQHRGARSGPRVHSARSNEAAPGSKGPRRHRRPGGNNGAPQTNRHEANRQELARPAQGGGKAEGMQGVAFLHRESRPNTRPNRTQRPQR